MSNTNEVIAKEQQEMNSNKSLVGMPTQEGKITNVFSDSNSFEAALKMANCLSRSTIVPKDYQGNIGNCMIAIEMSSRIGTSPMQVMQNLYVVNGRPAWSAQWIIAMINSSKRYKTELQFDFGHDSEDGGLSCRAWAEDYSGHKVYGPKITMTMAKDEGWTTKNGSKWKTMPDVMIQYRAASFFGRMNCPDMIMGIYSQDEVIDGLPSIEADFTVNVDSETGEIKELPESEDRIINQEERKHMLSLLRKYFDKEEGNEFVKKFLEDNGIDSTHNMTKSQLDELIALIVDAASNKIKDETQQAQENPSPVLSDEMQENN